MLVVRIDIEKNKENYQLVVDLLSELDIVSVAWETQVSVDHKPKTGAKGNDNLAASVSSAVDRVIERQRQQGQGPLPS